MRIVSAFAQDTGLPLIGTIPMDGAVMKAGIAADPVMALEGTPAMKEIERMTEALLSGTGLHRKTNKSPGGRK
jgi:CO dehydrogenase nickel-insertion accessory protein CooC1